MTRGCGHSTQEHENMRSFDRIWLKLPYCAVWDFGDGEYLEMRHCRWGENHSTVSRLYDGVAWWHWTWIVAQAIGVDMEWRALLAGA